MKLVGGGGGEEFGIRKIYSWELNKLDEDLRKQGGGGIK